MIKFSIIIPVYNAERYIEECLQSVCNQNLPKTDYEIILINDGSIDSSKDIILEFAVGNSNIVFIDQKNKGVSASRNEGLKVAKGEYIIFVDADDYIQNNILKNVYQQVKEKDIDLFYFHIIYVDELGKEFGFFEMENNDEQKIKDGFEHQRRGFIFGCYKKQTIKEIYFQEDVKIGEDALFNIMVHVNSERISYSPDFIYFYRKNPESTLANIKNTRSEEVFHGYLKTLKVLSDFLKENSFRFSPEQINYFERPFYKTAEMAIGSSIIPMKSFERLSRLKNTMVELNLQTAMKKVSKQYIFFRANSPVTFKVLFFLMKVKNKIKTWF
ncbi:MAG: glycosyltransferase family A protein [Moheibacter sp.]